MQVQAGRKACHEPLGSDKADESEARAAEQDELLEQSGAERLIIVFREVPELGGSAQAGEYQLLTLHAADAAQ